MDEDPLTERECMLSVVDPKGKGENKFRYVVVTQDEWLVCAVLMPRYSYWFSGLTFGAAEGQVTISGAYAADVCAAECHGMSSSGHMRCWYSEWLTRLADSRAHVFIIG
jgi:hypothetical protein